MSTTELPHCLLIPKSPMLSTCPSKTSRWSSALLLRRKAKMVLTKVTSSLTINKRRRMAILSPASSQLLALLRMFLVLFLISKWRLLLPPCPHPTVTIACWSVDLLWIFPLVVTLVLTFATKWMTAKKLLICILGSCETVANTSVVCTGKTGILTQNVMTSQQRVGALKIKVSKWTRGFSVLFDKPYVMHNLLSKYPDLGLGLEFKQGMVRQS